MRVDAHLHLNFLGFTSDGVVRYLDEHGFDRCWLMTWEEDPPSRADSFRCSADDVYAAYRSHPDRIVPMYAPDPRRGDVTRILETWRERGFRGCAELKTTIDWDAPEMRDYLAAVAATGMPVLFHMEAQSDVVRPLESDGRAHALLARAHNTTRLGGLPARLVRLAARERAPLAAWRRRRVTRLPAYPPGFDSLERALKTFPGLVFIGHGPLLWTQARRAGTTLRLLSEYSNLYVDISAASGFLALLRDRAFARWFLAQFSDRILFGTDNRPMGQLGFLRSLGLAPAVLDRVLGGNACRLVAR